MATALNWVEPLAGFKALYDLVKSGADYTKSLIGHRREPDTIRKRSV
jgi:hypothetical protein